MPEDKTREQAEHRGAHEQPPAQHRQGQQPPQPSQQGGQAGQLSADETLKIRQQAGSIAEVIEPVQRTRNERTN